MGLFDRLVRKATDQIINRVGDELASQAADAVKDRVVKNTKDFFDEIRGGEPVDEKDAEKSGREFGAFLKGLQDAAENGSLDAASADEDETSDIFTYDGRDVREKLEECFASEFSSYEIRKDVSPREFGGTGKFMNYSYAVYKDGAAKLFIMLTGKHTNSLREYRWSKEQAEKAGVPLINFVEHFPNNPRYISERLHQYLG